MNRFMLILAGALLIVPALGEKVSIVRLPDYDETMSAGCTKNSLTYTPAMCVCVLS